VGTRLRRATVPALPLDERTVFANQQIEMRALLVGD